MRKFSDYEKQLAEYAQRLACEGMVEPDYDVIFDQYGTDTTLGPDCRNDMLVGEVKRCFYHQGTLRKMIIPHTHVWGGVGSFDDGEPYMQEFYFFDEEGRLVRHFDWPLYRYGSAVPVRKTYRYREKDGELYVERYEESFKKESVDDSPCFVLKSAYAKEEPVNGPDSAIRLEIKRTEQPLFYWLEWMKQKTAEHAAAENGFRLIKGAQEVAKIFEAYDKASGKTPELTERWEDDVLYIE